LSLSIRKGLNISFEPPTSQWRDLVPKERGETKNIMVYAACLVAVCASLEAVGYFYSGCLEPFWLLFAAPSVDV